MHPTTVPICFRDDTYTLRHYPATETARWHAELACEQFPGRRARQNPCDFRRLSKAPSMPEVEKPKRTWCEPASPFRSRRSLLISPQRLKSYALSCSVNLLAEVVCPTLS